MRCAVGHLTRNFKIRGDSTNGNKWGGRVLIYQWANNDGQLFRGSGIFKGV